MKSCLELAVLGAGSVSPNPMVGCVIVHDEIIIGKGFHEKYGQAHAEVNAINSVKNSDLLKESTLYVTLEPCAHYGLTPPCSNLIIEKQISRVIIGTIDPFAKVAGRGIEKMIKAGIDVQVGILESDCRELNKRFFTFHEKKRPYIFLKWAQTKDGFIDTTRTEQNFGEPTWITGKEALVRVHKMRAVEDAIMVGTNTAQKDNPSLTVRHCEGKNPVRLVLDQNLRLDKTLNIFDNSVKTLVFNSEKNEEVKNTVFIKINFNKNIVPQVLKELHSLNLQSVIIEGGKQLLETFIKHRIWDEAWIFEGQKCFRNGIKAPKLQAKLIKEQMFGDDKLSVYKNEFTAELPSGYPA